MPFKIGTLTVGVVPDDAGFEADLRERIKAAAAGVNAEVGLRLGTDAEIFLDEDIHAAIDLATEGVKAEVGLGLKNDAVEALDADVKAGVELVEQDAKVKVTVDPQSAKAAEEGMSGLIIGAIAAAATFTPGAILSAASIATVGLGALVVKSNADIQAEYRHLASDVSDTLKTATAPLVPAVEASMVEAGDAVEKLKPTLDSLFTGVEPDLYTFTSGLAAGAEQFLPRFDQAVSASRGIVSDFAGGLPELLGGAGQFFTGLTTDSVSTGRGFEDLERVAGSTLGATGQVIGSFSAAASTALDAVTPAVTGVLNVISKLANPATIGALAGGLGMKQFGSTVKSGLQSASDSVLSFGAKVDGMGGFVGKLAPAAESASSGLSTMADVMGGPWGIAIGAGLGLMGGLVSSFRQGTASASDFTAAVQQDSDQVGANTEQIIQQTLAKSNLTAISKQLGLSQAQLIEYAAGDAKVQQEVAAAYDAKTAALNKSVAAQGADSPEAGRQAGYELNQLKEQKAALDAVTSAVAGAIKQTNDQNSALLSAEKATNVFTQQVNAEKIALQQSAQTALVNATALNESLAPQGQLTGAAIHAALAYQQASSATSQYTNSLTALYGEYGDTSEAEAAFTTALTGLKGQITSGTNAVNLHTKAGAANYTAFQQAATAAETYSEKIYQQTGDANQANTALQHAVTQIDAMARQSGLSATQVQKLNQELFGVKSAADINLNVNDSSVLNAISNVRNLNSLLTSDNPGAAGLGGVDLTRSHRATGGTGNAGQALTVGDAGHPETFVPDVDGYIYSTVDAGRRAIASHNAQVVAAAPAPGVLGMGGAPVVQNFYGSALPTIEQRATLRREMAVPIGAY